ncbi:MAG: hypothetical protein ABSD27_14075 [Bryobacteraceae bacterium]
MADRRLVLPVAGILLFLSCVPVAYCASLPVPPLVEAELLIPVSVYGTSVGKPIYARVVSDWQSPACALRAGGILKGRLVAAVARSRSAKTSSLALVFDSGECVGRQMKSLPLTVIAVLAPLPSSALDVTPPLNEAVGIGIEGGMRNVMTAPATANRQLVREERPATVTPGSVVGLRGLRLSVGTGPEGSSVVSATGQNVRLERGSRFYLVPGTTLPPPAAAGATATTAAPSSAPSPPPAVSSAADPPAALASVPVDETETCSPPHCSIVLPDANAAATARTEASVSIAELHYAPRLHREAYNFDHEAAVAFLGPGELLCTFNSHPLVERSAAEDATRVIRALLVDVTTMRVTRALDWRVFDDKQYLWPSYENRVLVHVGDELRVYGPGLRLQNKTKLAGPLAFLSTSPSGRTIALGIMRERHSPEIHRQLQRDLERPPEEDVEVRLLDGDLRLLGSWVHSGNIAVPVLSNGGELRLLLSSAQRYRIVEYGWNKQRRNVASIVSTCTPDLASVPPNLILVSGCAGVTRKKWCRVLKPDGQPILKTSCSSPEMMQYASGNDAGQLFALGVVEAAGAVIPGASFRATDLAEGRISIYNTQDGGLVAKIRIPSPTATEQTFALSPDGHRVAVLSGSSILFYDIPSSAAANQPTPKATN